jgi:hypothetical protein
MNAPETLQFRPGSGGVQVDLERLIASRALIQADSGGGKSWLLRYMIEQLYGRVQIIVLDPEGEFASLRERHDFLLAAADGDVSADPTTAKLLARRLLELNASAIVDIYELQLPARRKYIRLFLEELMHAPRRLWRPLLVIIDEAHSFAPQTGDAESLAAVVSLCTLGRKRGFAAVLATQRISKLHKDAAAELKNKFIGSCGLDLDMKRAGDELGFDKDARLGLRTMDPGTFYTFGPAISERGVNLVRSGAVKTTHPEPGAIAPPAPPPPAAVRKLLDQMKDLEREAEEEARSIEDLQKQLAAAKREVRKLERGAPAAAPVADEKAIARAVTVAERQMRTDFDQAQREQRGVDRQLRTQITELGKRLGRVGNLAGQIVQVCAVDLEEVAAAVPAKPNGSVNPAVRNNPQQEIKRTPRSRPAAPAASGIGREGLGKTALRILDAVGTLHSIGTEEPERSVVAGWVGMSATGGTFSARLSELRSAGVIEDRQGLRIALTDAGLSAAQVTDLPSLDELHSMWINKLGATAGRILKVLIDAYPDSMTRADVADAVEMAASGGTFSARLSELRKPGLITDISKTEVVAAGLLFPEGLR